MRKIALILVLVVVAGSTSVWAGDVLTRVWVSDVVHLDSPGALEHLRSTNPAHYAQAVKILAEANHLCRPAKAELLRAHPEANDDSCATMLLRASNPPKREVRFSLDHTQYVALVSITDDPPRLMAASEQPAPGDR
jgi:hypothetical protein